MWPKFSAKTLADALQILRCKTILNCENKLFLESFHEAPSQIMRYSGTCLSVDRLSLLQKSLTRDPQIIRSWQTNCCKIVEFSSGRSANSELKFLELWVFFDYKTSYCFNWPEQSSLMFVEKDSNSILRTDRECLAVCCSVLQCVTVCCSVL